jgi:hypothetical protein
MDGGTQKYYNTDNNGDHVIQTVNGKQVFFNCNAISLYSWMGAIYDRL